MKLKPGLILGVLPKKQSDGPSYTAFLLSHGRIPGKYQGCSSGDLAASIRGHHQLPLYTGSLVSDPEICRTVAARRLPGVASEISDEHYGRYMGEAPDIPGNGRPISACQVPVGTASFQRLLLFT